jgi:similar to stage IV sporulation protein
MIGAGLFVGVLMVLHMIVWQVEVVGETRLSHTHILQVAKQEGLFRGQWKGRLPQSDVLAVKLESQLPQAAWIGLKFIGSHAYIQVVDRTVPPAVTPQVNRNLVATHDAMVTEISAMKGTPVVRPNDHVTRGTVLISGLVGDAEHHVAVAADGIVRGLVWYTQTVVVPTETSLTRMTGPHQDKTYLHVFGRDWKLKGYRQTPYKHQKVVRDFAPPRIFGFKLPIPIIKQRAWKVETIRSKRNLLQASRVAMADADQNMLRSIGKDAQIRQRKLLHENLRDGKVYIKVHVEVEQEIMRESELIDQSFKR